MQVYLLTNTITQKRYVGKTSVGVSRRWTVHKCNAKRGDVSHLYRSIRKHGPEAFVVEVLEYDIPKEDINTRECFWIEQLGPEYNMTTGGEGGDTSSSPKFKKSMRDYHANKPREEYATYGMLGKKQTQEAKDKLSKAKMKRCVVEGIGFPSRTAAKKWVKEQGIRASVDRRIKDPRYPNYYML